MQETSPQAVRASIHKSELVLVMNILSVVMILAALGMTIMTALGHFGDLFLATMVIIGCAAFANAVVRDKLKCLGVIHILAAAGGLVMADVGFVLLFVSLTTPATG